MNLLQYRHTLAPEYTEGVLVVGDVLFCLLLEDPVRNLLEAADKVPGKTAIPAGTYQVVVEHSAKFGKDMVEIKGVDFFSETKYHCGADVTDSAGCPLMGLGRPAPGKLSGGIQAKLTEKLVALLKGKPGPHWLQIVEGFSLRAGHEVNP